MLLYDVRVPLRSPSILPSMWGLYWKGGWKMHLEKLELVVRYGKRTLTTKFVTVVDNEVHFDCKFVFSTGPDGPYAKQCCHKCWQCCILKCFCCACCSDNHLIVSICEPGINGQWSEENQKRCCIKRTVLLI